MPTSNTMDVSSDLRSDERAGNREASNRAGSRTSGSTSNMLLLAAMLALRDCGVRAAAENQTIFQASGPRSVGCYRSPTLLATDRTLLAFAAHHWDTHESECNDVGLKAIVVRSTIDGITCVHAPASCPRPCQPPARSVNITAARALVDHTQMDSGDPRFE